MTRLFLVFAGALACVWVLSSKVLMSHAAITTTVTFDREIVRILNRKCVACHSTDNLSIPLTTYEETRPWARAILEEVLLRRMPPWRAVSGYGAFANGTGLTTRELQFITAWVEGNGPRTKNQTIFAGVEAGSTDADVQLKPDFERWQLGTPALIQPLPRVAVPAGQAASVRRVTVQPDVTADRWIRAVEFKPGDRRVVRAAFFFLEGRNEWIGSWTPWHRVATLPAGVAYKLPAGSRIVAEVHYYGTSEAVEDESRLGLHFATAPSREPVKDLAIETQAAGAAESVRRFSGRLPLSTPVSVLAVRPDFRPEIDSIEVSFRKPDGTMNFLLLVNDVLPGWPTPYVLKQPVQLAPGTELRVTYMWNGSASSNPTPPPGLIVQVHEGVTAQAAAR